MQRESIEVISVKGSSHAKICESSHSASDVHSSYRKRIDDEFGKESEYDWLRRFLNTPGPSASETHVTILDCIDGQMENQGCFSAVDDRLLTGARCRSDGVELRLIVTTYPQSWLVDRSIVDYLSSEFDIHPDFLRRHFYYYFIYVEDAIPQDDFQYETDDIHKIPPAILSDENQDEAHLAATRSYHKLSACVHRRSNTVLIWIREQTMRMDHTEPLSKDKALMHRYLFKIQHMSAKEIRAGSAEWTYFLYPYAKDLVLNFLAISYSDTRDMTTENFIADDSIVRGDLGTVSGHLYQVMYESGALKKLQYELKRISSQCGTPEARRKFDLLQDDAEYVNQNFEHSAQYFREAKNGALTAAQVDEAHASTDAALSVNRLSRLAFFFIPLSFTTSLFGMNVTEFGQGTIPIRTFFITAVVIGICTVIPLWYSMVVAVKKSGVVDNTRIVLRLLRYSPTLAVQYAGLCVQFEHSVVMSLCGEDIAALLGLRLVFGYRFMQREEAVRRMSRSYYSFGNDSVWDRRAKNMVETLERLKQLRDVGT